MSWKLSIRISECGAFSWNWCVFTLRFHETFATSGGINSLAVSEIRHDLLSSVFKLPVRLFCILKNSSVEIVDLLKARTYDLTKIHLRALT